MRNQKVTYRQTYITDCSESNIEFITLYHIFEATLKPGMHYREFRAYFLSNKLHYIDVTFIIQNKKIIGFCSAAFYTGNIEKKIYIIGRAAIGILENYRGKKLPKWKLYKKYIRYWLRYPFRNIILSAYVANPLIYAMICKYTGISFPRKSSLPPENIIHIKNQLLRSQNLHNRENPAFVVEIHFCVAISDREEKRIMTSKDGFVQYYLKINPKYRQQYGVVVIIPVTFQNIVYSSCKFLYYAIMNYVLRFIRLLLDTINILLKEKSVN